MTRIVPEDLVDAGILSEEELVADGSTSYRVDAIADVTSGVVNLSGSVQLTNTDDPVEAGDKVVITGSTASDGTYTVNALTDPYTGKFTVVEAISDSTGGSADFRHPAGAARVGVDPSTIPNVTSTNVQGALEDLGGSIGAASFDKILTKRSNCAVVVLRSNGNVVTRA